jgi:phosphoribosylamine--glycine ligase
MPNGVPPRFTWMGFFAVRPSFTLGALRLVWFAVLIREALAYTAIVERALSDPAEAFAIRYALIDGAIVSIGRLILLRLLLEIAAAILAPGAASAQAERRTFLTILGEIFALRPVFTATCLRLVWFGYLAYTLVVYAGTIKQLLDIEPAFIRVAPAAILTALVSPFVWLTLVRVLVEIGGRVLPKAAAAAGRTPRRINVLLIGGGGREHALAWKIAKSPHLARLYAAPGNPGIAEQAELVALDVADSAAVTQFCRARFVELVVIGPETPLVAGLVDDLAAAGIAAFGPGRDAARLEGSKGYTKDLAREAGIPTAAYGRFTDREGALAYVESRGAPIVVKADGLAAGKGVTVATTVAEALAAVDACFAGALGSAGGEVVVEDYLAGEEASFFVLADGMTVLPLATAQDHKRVGDGDTGPNTGGMGAYSPAPVMTPDLVERTLAEIIRPTLAALHARGAPFRGVLYAGLMITSDGPKLIEYNVRFGDPEAQVLMMRLDSDLLELLYATARGRLAEVSLRWSEDAALTVVMAAKGYPGTYATGSPIRGIERAEALPDVKVFQAGTARRDGALIANGGRVLNVTARGKTIAEAKARAYAAVDLIDWPEAFCRRDIGWQAVTRDSAD